MTLNADSAVVLFDELLAHYKTNGDSCKYARALLQQGVNRLILSEVEPALKNLQKAEGIFDQGLCPEMYQAKVALLYSLFYYSKGDNKLADSIALMAISNYDTSWSNKATYIKLHYRVFRADGEEEKALPYLLKALSLAKKWQYPLLELRLLHDIAVNYAIAGEFETAVLYFKRVLVKATADENYILLSTVYNNLAGLSSDSSFVVSYLDSAIYYADLNGNLYDLQVYTENKALFYYDYGKYKQAYGFLWKASTLKDSLYNGQRYKALTELEKKYETEKKSNQIQVLKVENLKAELAQVSSQKNLNKVMIGALALLLIASLTTYGFITIRKNRNLLAKKNLEISIERKRSEELLLNILPAEIAQELKDTGHAKARDFEKISILFTDFKDFTRIASEASAGKLVEELNACFKAFDAICETYKIEKIKTIGDSYMAAGGLSAQGLQMAENTVLAALEMQRFIAKRNLENTISGKTAFEMRVGVHTGPVVAGIVGVKKFQYDIWGDTVNTASRMESNGEVGKVNISQVTYELLNEAQTETASQFKFESRGKIKTKGKGEMDMWFVRFNDKK